MSPDPRTGRESTAAITRRWVRRLAPWVIATVAIAAILTEYPAARIVAEMGRGDVTWMAPLAAVLVLVSLFVVAAADVVILAPCIGRLSYRDVVRGKAGSALLDIVSYAVGHGSYAVWIARKSGSRPGDAAGALLFLMSSDLTTVCAMGAVALAVGEVDLGALNLVAPLVAGVLFTLKMIGPWRPFGLTSRVFAPWSELRRGPMLINLAGRLFQQVVFLVLTYAAMRGFGLEIPFWVLATYLPLVLVVGSMPVNVAGFGAVQGVWLLMTPWAPGERILAFQVLWNLATTAAIVIRGLPFVRRLVAEVAEGRRGAER